MPTIMIGSQTTSVAKTFWNVSTKRKSVTTVLKLATPPNPPLGSSGVGGFSSAVLTA